MRQLRLATAAVALGVATPLLAFGQQAPTAALYDEWAGEDAVLTVEEWDAAINARFGEQAVNLDVTQWDADGDGVISRAEFDDAAARGNVLSTQATGVSPAADADFLIGAAEGGTLERETDIAAIEVPEGYEVEVFAEGLSYPTDITFGANGEAYVSEAGGHFYGTDPAHAPPPRILRVEPDGTTSVVYENVVPVEAIRAAGRGEELPEGLISPIEGITYNPDNGLIHVAHRSRVSTLDPETGEFRTIIDNLPAWGIFHNTKIIFDDQGRMVFGISAQGNSGIVDAGIMKVIAFYDMPEVREIPCETVTLTGRDFSVANGFTPEQGDVQETGVYVPYGTTTETGQTLEGEFWCNSALYRANADGSNPERLAWGIRNAFHYEFSPDGRLIFSNNSGNPIPGRPVYDDWETFYALEEGVWYGWPDYFSSVPITDERFRRPNDPQFQQPPFPHEFVLTEETRQRLLAGRETPPPPLVRLHPHAAAQGFTFAPEEFGLAENEILLAEFGPVIPYLAQEAPGFRVSRVNLDTGETQPFIANKSGNPASVTKGSETLASGGLERPLRLEVGPDGSLYIVDFGVIDIAAPPPKRNAYANTGVIWRVSRQPETAEADEPAPRSENQ